jgi:7,8-dihydropterin-6-yl-methyl-4-(beta-D-ribofuranosyl)aminobenzene 5'-phosphate synthase
LRGKGDSPKLRGVYEKGCSCSLQWIVEVRERLWFLACFYVIERASRFITLPVNMAENSITCVYNNVPGNTGADVRVGAGFSAFIAFKQRNILFDVGADATILLKNILALGIDARRLDAVVISHNHWDHVYGLPGIYALEESDPDVYVAASSRGAILEQNPRSKVVPIDEPRQIFPCIWSTGSMRVEYRDLSFSEQALILDNDDGIYVVTGCAHPGIVNIVERAKQLLPEKSIAMVAGGFHLVSAIEQEIMDISAKLKKLGVKKIAPSHCTGQTAMQIFEEEWGEHYVRLYLGDGYRF